MSFSHDIARRRNLQLRVLSLAVLLLAACGGGDDDGSPGVEYFPPGGVSEEMRSARTDARLNLDHTVVTWLEAAGGHEGDTGDEDGVDEFAYHFDTPTELRLSLDEFDEAPTLIALDGEGNELARVDGDSGDAIITASGEHRFRFVHPHAGDASAAPILFFFRPLLPESETDGGAALTSGATGLQANSDDVATLKAGKDCFRCNLAGLSWNACPGVSLAGVNLSHSDFTSAVLACQTFESKSSTPTLLTATNFTNANLSTLTMKDVDLTDANFAGASFDVVTFDSVTATAIDFSDAEFANSIFGAAKGSGSSAYGATFAGAQFVRNSCLSTYDLRDSDFTSASFDSTSSVHGTLFAGANLYGVSFDGTKFAYSSTLPDCGQTASCTTVSVSGLCSNCPCTADFACREVESENHCVENQGPVSLSSSAVCQRPTVQPDPLGVLFQDSDLVGISFDGADFTNSMFVSSSLDNTSNFTATELGGVDFSQQDLGKAVDLSKAFLSATTNFEGAVLTDAANSRGVILSCNITAGTGGCEFPSGTEQFKGADLRYALLDDVELSQADLAGVNLTDASLVGADLSFANLQGASLKGATLGTAPGAGGAASLRGAYMINVDLTDADLRSVDLTAAHLYGAASDALFVRAALDSANLTDAILAGAVFTDATLNATVLNGAQLANASFEGATLTNAKFDDAYLQGVDFSSAASVTGMSLSNAAVSTNLTSTKCTLIPPGSWTYMDQDGTPYTYSFGATMLQKDPTMVCPDNAFGPCDTGDSLCPIMSGPFPPIPPCVPVEAYCYENCLSPPCFLDVPDSSGICPLVSNCS